MVRHARKKFEPTRVQTAWWSVADYERVKVYANGTGAFDGKHVFSAEIQSYARF